MGKNYLFTRVMCLIFRDRGLFKIVMMFALANSSNVKDKPRQTGILSIERGWCHCLFLYAFSILFKQATAVTPFARAHLSGWSCTGICVLRSLIPGVFLWNSHWEWMYSGPKNVLGHLYIHTYIQNVWMHCINYVLILKFCLIWKADHSVLYGKLITLPHHIFHKMEIILKYYNSLFKYKIPIIGNVNK